MVFAAEKADLAFILNVVINEKKQIVRAFAGDREKAHETGCEFLRSVCGITVPQADIVITGNGGYPLDQNIYQCVKGMTAGEAVCRPGGVIILAASCSDGHGGKEFYRVLSECSSAEDLLISLSGIPGNKTTPDQWQYQILARILAKFKVIMVTEDCDHQMIREMKMEAAHSIGEAFEMALKHCGKNSRTVVIPDGVSVIAESIQEK
jgi:nickel-dependent lactate racemase